MGWFQQGSTNWQGIWNLTPFDNLIRKITWPSGVVDECITFTFCKVVIPGMLLYSMSRPCLSYRHLGTWMGNNPGWNYYASFCIVCFFYVSTYAGKESWTWRKVGKLSLVPEGMHNCTIIETTLASINHIFLLFRDLTLRQFRGTEIWSNVTDY